MSQTSFQWVPIDFESVVENILKPQAVLEMKSKSGEWKVFYADVDTGTSVSVFTESDCDRLGLTLTDGTKFTLGGVFGSGIAYLHKVEMKIGDEIIKARIGFTLGNYKQLLGRVDILDNFRICLSGKNKQTTFSKE